MLSHFCYSLEKQQNIIMMAMVDTRQVLDNWSVRIQCTFTIQYCIIYIPWAFKAKATNSRTTPRSDSPKAEAKKFGLKAKSNDQHPCHEAQNVEARGQWGQRTPPLFDWGQATLLYHDLNYTIVIGPTHVTWYAKMNSVAWFRQSIVMIPGNMALRDPCSRGTWSKSRDTLHFLVWPQY